MDRVTVGSSKLTKVVGVSAGKKKSVRSRLPVLVGAVDMADDELCVYSPCIDCIARVAHWPGHQPQGIKWRVLQGEMTIHLMREDFAPTHTPSTLMRKVHASVLVGVCDGAQETFARYRRSGHHFVAASTCGVVRQSLCVSHAHHHFVARCPWRQQLSVVVHLPTPLLHLPQSPPPSHSEVDSQPVTGHVPLCATAPCVRLSECIWWPSHTHEHQVPSCTVQSKFMGTKKSWALCGALMLSRTPPVHASDSDCAHAIET